MESKIWDCSFSQEDIEVTIGRAVTEGEWNIICLLYTSPSPRDRQKSRMPSSA